jgi:CRISPR-associated protein Cmr1
MESITFTCETITPMFLAGADGQTPELRAPSIKGALRFWWRAMHGDLVLEELKEKEEEIFGSTKKRSSIIIRVNPNEVASDFQIDGNKLENKTSSDYFFYSLIHGYQENNAKQYKKGIKENFPFKIEIRSRTEANLKEAIKAFRFLVYLGGLGTRCRRCAGAFRVIEITDEKNYLKKWNLLFSDSFQKLMIEKKDLNTGSIHDKFSNFQNAEFYRSNHHFRNWKDVISDIAMKMKGLREGINPLNSESFNQSDLDMKAAFGLPISVRNEKEQVNFSDTTKNNRRASQFYLSVYATEKNRLWWILTKFKDEFMPPGQSIKFKRHEWGKPNYSLSEEFLERLNANKL